MFSKTKKEKSSSLRSQSVNKHENNINNNDNSNNNTNNNTNIHSLETNGINITENEDFNNINQNIQLNMSSIESKFRKSEIIKLNIGGFKYETTVCTLTRIPDTYFTLLLSGRFPIQKDEKGAFFIDRDGQFFAPILIFLRTDEVTIPSSMSKKDVKRESEFFLIQPLLDKLKEMDQKQRIKHGKNLFSTNQEQRNKALEDFFGLEISNPTTEYIMLYLEKYHTETCKLLKQLRNELGALQVLLHVCTGEHPPRLESLKVWRGRQIYSNPIGISIGLECKASPRAVEVIADYLMEKGFSGKVWHSQSIHCSQCSSSSTNILLCWNHHARIIDDFGSCCKPVTDYRFGTSVVSLQNDNDIMSSLKNKSSNGLV